MDKKIIKKIEKALEAHFKITKETEQMIYFEVASFKGSYNKNMNSQAPKWFKDFAKEMLDFKSNQENFNSEVVSFMKNQENFNSEIKSSIQGINTRIDNLITKNKLQE